MTLTVFLVVIGAAILHATWNAAVKGSGDKVVGMAAVMIGQMLPAALLLIYFPGPSFESLPWFIAGVALHLGYQYFLIAAYRVGDFTQVYPIARGSAPLIVTVISVLFLGVKFAPTELIAIGLIVLGIISLSIVRQEDGLRNPKAALMALCTGCCIAGYSLADGLGARASESAIGFIAMLMIVNSILFLAFLAVFSPGKISRVFQGRAVWLLSGGWASALAYMLAVWAFTQAPIAIVTALRETSIVFALLIGVFFFREQLNLAKVLSTMMTLGGALLLRFGRHLT